ncbi:MAG: trypsin-like peptidase domain-containing protein [Myxococcales bacterium]|nr:trypsin-like peptidase domain-containing protein [Myxococcales bacterium]
MTNFAPHFSANRGRRTLMTAVLLAALTAGGRTSGLVQVPEAHAQTDSAVTPKMQAPPEARALSRAFAGTAKALGPSVVRIDVEAKSPKQRPQARRDLPDDVPDIFRHFFEFGGGGGGMPSPGPVHGTGSGVVIDTKGHILTNSHVVKGADDVKVTFADGRDFEGEVVGRDEETDVAVVRLQKTPTALVAARLGDSDKLEVGEFVLAVGSPLGMDQTVTAGIVSSKGKTNGRMRMSGNRVRQYIQTDAMINPGNSGGPLSNLDGEVIGINTLINTGPGGAYGFAIPINQAKRVAQALIKDGKMRYAFLGVSIVDLERLPNEARAKLGKNLPERAAVVEKVTPNGPAEKAGVRPQDVVTKIDDQAIESASDVVAYISDQPIGSQVKLTYVREGRPNTVKVTLAELSQDEQTVASVGDGRIGLALQSLTPEIAQGLGLPAETKGAVITEVAPGSRAERAGLAPEDVILKINRKPVSDSEAAVQVLKENPKGRQLLQVRRGNATRFVTIPPA